ncbi:MAG: hypothetical protein ABSB22_11950 [Thermodesulfobacteriota bacterium]
MKEKDASAVDAKALFIPIKLGPFELPNRADALLRQAAECTCPYPFNARSQTHRLAIE